MSAANLSRNLHFVWYFWGGTECRTTWPHGWKRLAYGFVFVHLKGTRSSCGRAQMTRPTLWSTKSSRQGAWPVVVWEQNGCSSCGSGARMLRLDVRDLIAVACCCGSCMEAKWSSRSHTKSANVTFADWIPNAKCLKPSCFTFLDDPSNCSEEKHGQVLPKIPKRICHRFSQTHSAVGKQERSGKLVEALVECWCRFQTMVCVQRLWYNKKL